MEQNMCKTIYTILGMCNRSLTILDQCIDVYFVNRNTEYDKI